VIVAFAVVVFAVGIALGQAIQKNGGDDGSVTFEQTVRIPSERQTVTVTVTSP
jgi:uncharacterized protein HemY